jgi:hypothetical protein
MIRTALPEPGGELTVAWSPGEEVDAHGSPWPRFRHHWPTLNQTVVGKIVGHSYAEKLADLRARVASGDSLAPSGIAPRLLAWILATITLEEQR